MTTTTAPSKADIADAVEKAAGIVDTNGHHKGYLYDEKQADDGTPLADCRVDAVGAINIAVFGQPSWPAEDHPGSRLVELAAEALMDTIDGGIPGWNDEPKRQKRQVVKALRDTAASLRKAAA